MGQPFIGQILAVGFNFVPSGWLPCDGSQQSISEYETLYALLGTTYGGNGTTTFAMPDLRGRSPLNAGQGSGLSTYVLGQTGGSETVTLSTNQIALHNHLVKVSASTANSGTPGGNVVIGQLVTAPASALAAAPGTTTMAPGVIGSTTGGNQPHENRQPFSTVNYIICAYGIYPSQN